MKITFLGGVETVTGSKFLVETSNTSVLVDCGMFQGYKRLRERNWESPLFDVGKLDAVVLTHAHLDHSGYIPVLGKRGYKNPIYTHYATRDLCDILLKDSGHIQEEDAKYYAKHKIGKRKNPSPLYTSADAQQSMSLFNPVNFSEQFSIGDINIHLQPAGHILGAGSIIIETEGKRIGFSGDVGRPDDVLMRAPAQLPELDLLLLESTYGNRRHYRTDPFQQFETVINKAVEKGGTILIPSFSVGRAQALMHIVASLKSAGRIANIPVFLDSPMAINVSDIYCKYEEHHNLSREECKAMCAVATYTSSVDDSKALANMKYPHIIIAGSGMATGGRILHHMKRLLSDHRTTLLFTGYQAGGTRGAKMMGGEKYIRIHGQNIFNRSNVQVLEGMSGHADYLDIEKWLQQSALDEHTPIQLIHGDPHALEGFETYLQDNTRFEVSIAGYRKTLRI